MFRWTFKHAGMKVEGDDLKNIMTPKATALFKVEIEEGSVNEYLFYADGKIEHRFDRDDKVENVNPSAIDDMTFQLLLEKCPYEFKGRLKEMVNRN